MEQVFLLFISILALTVLSGYLGFNYLMVRRKYSKIISIEDECNKVIQKKSLIEEELEIVAHNLKKLTDDYQVFFDSSELLESGVINLEYNFSSSRDYEAKLEEIRDEQKIMIKDKQAIICTTVWTVSGSKTEGKRMINQVTKLALNAFNSQCDNIMLNVKYSNYEKSKEKILKLEKLIEKQLESNRCQITTRYIDLKFKELDLIFGYQEKLQEEKDEQKRIRIQMQEEEKVRREIEKLKDEAEKEEIFFEKALVKARKELEKKNDSDKDELLLKIQELEQQLTEAHQKKERALSQAELTKRGHVYIISNIGSFGEEVFKIGMTRRLDPMERIDELGDASVPFDFDVHAMIFSENAPELEGTFHKLFSSKRVNKVNQRKEFFITNINEIENACETLKLQIKLTKLAEAREYWQSKQRKSAA